MRRNSDQKNMSQLNPLDYFVFTEKAEFQPVFLMVNKVGLEGDDSVGLQSDELGNDTNIVKSISIASDKITNALNHPKVTPFFSTALLIPVITGLVGASAAFFYNKLHWYSVKSREEKIKKIDALIEIVISLEEVAVDYWMKNYAKKLSRDNKKAEIKIKSHLALINTLIKDVIDNEPSRKQDKLRDKFIIPHGELFDLITGDDFESSSRKSNPSKSDQISSKCLKFRVALTTGL